MHQDRRYEGVQGDDMKKGMAFDMKRRMMRVYVDPDGCGVVVVVLMVLQ